MGNTLVDILGKQGVELSEDELAHYGKLGMKWGRRKKQSSSDDSSEPSKPRIKDMSDDELKSAINRLKMEKEYATLTAPQVNQGRKIVGEILKEVGKQQAKTFINKNLESLLYPEKDKAAEVVTKVAKKAVGRQVMRLNPSHGLKI